MPRLDQRIDNRLVLDAHNAIDRTKIVLPLRQRTRSGDDRTHRAIRKHQAVANWGSDGPVASQCARRAAMSSDRREIRFASCAYRCARRACLPPVLPRRVVFGGKHAARDGTVGHHADAVLHAKQAESPSPTAIEQVCITAGTPPAPALLNWARQMHCCRCETAKSWRCPTRIFPSRNKVPVRAAVLSRDSVRGNAMRVIQIDAIRIEAFQAGLSHSRSINFANSPPCWSSTHLVSACQSPSDHAGR